MRRIGSAERRRLLRTWVLAISAVVVLNQAQALRITGVPSELQTKNDKPVERTLSLKLPLSQPVLQWTFKSKADFLAGRLVLHVIRDGVSTPIKIFENGAFKDGWESTELKIPKAGEVYFGLQSSKKYPTAPGDRLRIELLVARDLEGIGPTQTGFLPAGTYISEGIYSGLIDEYAVPEEMKNLPEETIGKLREAYEFRAFLENWDQQWSLKITGEEGWLDPAQREAFEELKKQMEQVESKTGKHNE